MQCDNLNNWVVAKYIFKTIIIFIKALHAQLIFHKKLSIASYRMFVKKSTIKIENGNFPSLTFFSVLATLIVSANMSENKI